MKLVVDTNIVFSALLNPGNTLAEILLNPQNSFQFYSPNLLVAELQRHQPKLSKLSGLSQKALGEASGIIMERISLISEELIKEDVWLQAAELTKGVDESDTPFVALAMELNVPLWTGDKKLINGLREKDFNMLITTEQLFT